MAAARKKKELKKGKEKQDDAQVEGTTAALLREILAELRRLNENLERRSVAAAGPQNAAGLQEAAAVSNDDSDADPEDMDEFE